MKTLFFTFLILGLLSTSACENSVEPEKMDLVKKEDANIYSTWVLTKEVQNGKVFNHSQKSSTVCLTMKENGFFIFFDRITNKKMNDSGINQIQERYKGQFEFDGSKLVLKHFINDSIIVENYVVQEFTPNELILKDTKTENIHYFKK